MFVFKELFFWSSIGLLDGVRVIWFSYFSWSRPLLLAVGVLYVQHCCFQPPVAVLLTSFSLRREAQVNTKITVNLFYGKLTSREEAGRHFHKPIMTACHCSAARISPGMTKWFEVHENIKGLLFFQGHGQMGSGVWQAYMKVMIVWKREWMKPKLEQDVAIKAEHGMKKDY